ncbi:hypothetical protein DESC_460172 [Desulfosarcina cetonica]|uniref:hypothetical protein n=1 Tax=Desulfosarcina cetonica TaxID=90730 RepID=UPI0006CFBCD3|nr:hypothetical protein [Desulfosarcina cetonica]VTR66277.1 hypothetical protein DESC_460172 [Desulfosarcina cetonica]
MNLEYALNQLDTNVTNLKDYSVLIIKDYDRVTQDLPFEEFHIYGVDIEDEDKEITLLTDKNEGNCPLKASELFEKLNKLMPKCKDHILFSGSSIVDLGEDYSGRLDSPLIALGFDNEGKKIAFVQKGKNS